MITQKWNWDHKVEVYKELQNDPEINIALKLEQLKATDFDLVPLKDSVPEAKKRIEHPDELEGISTGYHNLDNYLGGLAPEELIVVAGGTGQGKTHFVQSIIVNIALSNEPVLFFTLEMPPVETTVRFMRMIKTKDDTEILPELPIYYYYGTNVTLPILDRAIEKGKKMGIKCVVIDHIHFFAKSTDNQAAEIGNIAREIKLMARKYEIPIILIAHIRKTNNPKRIPTLEDIKDSSGVAQDADSILMVWRDMDADSERIQRTLKVKVRKNRRRGKLGGCQYYLDYNSFLQEEEYEKHDDDF